MVVLFWQLLHMYLRAELTWWMMQMKAYGLLKLFVFDLWNDLWKWNIWVMTYNGTSYFVCKNHAYRNKGKEIHKKHCKHAEHLSTFIPQCASIQCSFQLKAISIKNVKKNSTKQQQTNTQTNINLTNIFISMLLIFFLRTSYISVK